MKTVDLINVTKEFNSNIILNNLKYAFDNKLYLITGENGIGKSSLLKLIFGLYKPTNGKVKVYGKMSFLPERYKVPNFVNMYEFLKTLFLIKNNHNIDNNNIDKYLNIFKIYKYKNSKMNTLSKGTIQKIMIISTLLDNSDIYLFDEPLNGLDNESQHIFLSIINNLINNHKTVIISTHYIDIYNSLESIILKVDRSLYETKTL